MDKIKRFKLNLEIFRDIFMICLRVHGQDFDALPTNEEIVSFLKDLEHKSFRKQDRDAYLQDDYLINTLRFVSAKEATKIYGAILPKSSTSPEMKEIKAYKTYIGFAIGAAPPKKARKFKKPAFPQLTTIPVSPEEPTGKSKRVKRPAKRSTKALARGVVIIETPEMPLYKKKEKITVEKRKGIDLLFEVALTEEAYEAESWGNDKDDSNNEQDSCGEDSDQENDSDDDKTQSNNEN
ncbi:hypothetical protein Tco_1483774 [Tanacetum coccineum]